MEFDLFKKPTDTPTLPGGNGDPYYFETTAGFGAIAAPPPAFTGIDPGESLGLLFDLVDGQGVEQAWDKLKTGDLRIGMHVISIGENEEYSDGYLSIPPGPPGGGGGSPIPEPTSLAIWGLGLLACLAVHFGRRRNGAK